MSFTRRGHGLHVTVLPRMQLPVPEYQYVCSGKKGDKEFLGSGRSKNNIFLHCTELCVEEVPCESLLELVHCVGTIRQ